MKLERLDGHTLANLADNILELLESGRLPSIDPVVSAELIALIGDKPAELGEKTAAAEAIDLEKQAAFSSRDFTHAEVVEWTRRVRDLLRACRAPESEYVLAGFDAISQRANAHQAQDPTNLSVRGFSNGVNKLNYRGNNRHGLVVYEIWRRTGREGTWQKHDLTRKQTYQDREVTPGQFYEYRVRAVAAQTASQFSNVTVVYGIL